MESIIVIDELIIKIIELFITRLIIIKNVNNILIFESL